ncbi:MAG: winged helix DNA-binding protein [Mangrovibacterium sp.]
MENSSVNTLCRVRDLYRAIADFECLFQQQFGICLNEGMLLCTLQNQELSSSEIAQALGLSSSNTSKVIKSVENKGFISRNIGKSDKRQMNFSLSAEGKKQLKGITSGTLPLPTLLETI